MKIFYNYESHLYMYLNSNNKLSTIHIIKYYPNSQLILTKPFPKTT